MFCWVVLLCVLVAVVSHEDPEAVLLDQSDVLHEFQVCHVADQLRWLR